MMCGVFCGAGDRLVSELTDSEDWLARDLAGVHLALGQLDEQRRQQERLRDEAGPEIRRGEAMKTSPTAIEPVTSTVLAAEDIRWSFDEPEPALCHQPAPALPQGLKASRADLVTWWRWRYAALEAEHARVGELLVQALSEAQSYRQVSQAALDALHDLTDMTRRQRQTIARVRDEIRRLREPVKAVTA